MRGAKTARAVLAVIVAVYFAFLWFYVPRLTNYTMGDREFSGWVSPIAERFARGERPYVDFVLPIPPGSFLLLAAIQRLVGAAFLRQELWVAGLSHLVMGVLSYGIVTSFAPRKIGLLAALSTLVLVTQTPKHCVYDHTSLVVAWLAVLCASRALVSASARARRRLWFVTGLLCMLTLGFKQSTAVGMLSGTMLSLAYLIVVEAVHHRQDGVQARIRDALAWGVGTVVGLGLVVALLALSHAPVSAAFQAVLVDGPALKGGIVALLRNLVTFTVKNDAIRNTLVPTAILFAILLSLARKHGHLHLGDAGHDGDAEPLQTSTIVTLTAAALATYGGAIALLAGEVPALPRAFTADADSLRNVPAYGFAFGAAFFAAHLSERHAATAEARDRGHALNAMLLGTLAASMIYDTSFINFYPFYYNEPSIPLALACLYLATERCGLRFATPLALLCSLLPTFGIEFGRALSADTIVQGGFWSGLRVNYRGLSVLDAAARARELAGTSGTVLVLPEDVEIAGLIERPRPPLRGAIVFVDQYPERLLAADVAAFDRSLPDVLVVHPHRDSEWRKVFHTWAEQSAAERFVNHVLADVLPSQYRLAGTFPSIYFWDQGQIDVYARKDRGPP